MAKGKDYRITMEQGQFLLGLAVGFRTMPDKLGARTFTAIERAAGDRDVLALYDAIKTVSPLLREHGKKRGDMFGPADNWDIEKDKDGNLKSGSMKDEQVEVDIRLSDKAISGAMWCMLFASHPDSAAPRAGSKIMVDVLQPLAFRLRRLMALEDELGIRNAKSKEWPEDDADEQDEHEDTKVLPAPIAMKAEAAS